MTQPYKKTYHYVVTAFAVLVFITPMSSHAEDKITDAKLCSQLPQLRVRLDQAIDDRADKIAAAKTDRLKTLAIAWQKEAAAKEAEQKLADAKRAEHFETLKSKSTSDADMANIVAFQKNVDAAVVVRRTAIDEAFNDYKGSVGDMLDGKLKKIQDLRASYGTTVKSAFTTANTDCNKGIKKPAIREKIKSALQNLETNYQTNKGSILNVEEDMRNLAKARREKVQAAEAAFKQSIEQASAQFSHS